MTEREDLLGGLFRAIDQKRENEVYIKGATERIKRGTRCNRLQLSKTVEI